MAELTPPAVSETVARLGCASLGMIAAVSLGVLAATVGAADSGEPINQEAIVVSLPVFVSSIGGTAWMVWIVAGWNAVRKNKEDGLEREISELRAALKQAGIDVQTKGKR